MVTLNKQELLDRVTSAIRLSGWWPLIKADKHPFEIQAVGEDSSKSLRIYIWNITHGGGSARAKDEFRIQITGNNAALNASGVDIPLILGWHDTLGVFAGFDPVRHKALDSKSFSPSIQVKMTTLNGALNTGVSFQQKGPDEIVAAFAPSFFMNYALAITSIHGLASNLQATNAVIAASKGGSPPTTGLSPPRKKLAQVVSRYSRSSSFRRRVLAAYTQRCAFCGIQLGLVEAAHIVPVGDPRSTDETRNGISACPIHHTSYDTGLVQVTPSFDIGISTVKLNDLSAQGLIEGLRSFRGNLLPKLILPADVNDHPSVDFIKIGAQLRGY